MWAYRGFIVSSAVREIRARYRGSLLGAAWIVIGPLTMILIYTLIFAQIMRARLPGSDSEYAYSIYLCAGLLPWGLFSEILQRSQSLFIDNANLIKKASFPPLSLLVIVILTAGFNFFLMMLLFLSFLAVSGNLPGIVLFAALPSLVLLVMLAASAGIFTAVVNVFFRDVGQLMGVVLQLLFWLTPIVYSASIIPDWAKSMLSFNPLYGLIVQLQAVFLGAKQLPWHGLLYPAVGCMVMSVVAFLVYRRLYGDMVDEL